MLQVINQGLAACHDAECQLHFLETQLGIDVSELRNELLSKQIPLTRVKATYFPESP